MGRCVDLCRTYTTAGLDLPKFFGPRAEQNNQQKEVDGQMPLL